MLPPDTPIPVSKAGRPRKRKDPPSASAKAPPKAAKKTASNVGRPRKTPAAAAAKSPPKAKKTAPQKAKKTAERPSTPDSIALTYDSDEEDPGPDSDPETSLDVPVRAKADWTRPTTVHWDPDSPDGSKVGWKVRLWDDVDNEWRDGRILLYDPYTHQHKVQYDIKPRKGERVDSQNCVWVRLVNEVSIFTYIVCDHCHFFKSLKVCLIHELLLL